MGSKRTECAIGIQGASSCEISCAFSYSAARSACLVTPLAFWMASSKSLLHQRETLPPPFTAEQPSSGTKKLSGSPLSPDQPNIIDCCSPVLLRLRYSPHSKVISLALTPTLSQSAWISSAMRLPSGLYGRVTGRYQRSTSTPFG